MPRRKTNVTLDLPPEFTALCKRDNVPPEVVLRGFIADLCELLDQTHGYQLHGSSECQHAQAYYDRVGYSWWYAPRG